MAWRCQATWGSEVVRYTSSACLRVAALSTRSLSSYPCDPLTLYQLRRDKKTYLANSFYELLIFFKCLLRLLLILLEWLPCLQKSHIVERHWAWGAYTPVLLHQEPSGEHLTLVYNRVCGFVMPVKSSSYARKNVGRIYLLRLSEGSHALDTTTFKLPPCLLTL